MISNKNLYTSIIFGPDTWALLGESAACYLSESCLEKSSNCPQHTRIRGWGRSLTFARDVIGPESMRHRQLQSRLRRRYEIEGTCYPLSPTIKCQNLLRQPTCCFLMSDRPGMWTAPVDCCVPGAPKTSSSGEGSCKVSADFDTGS